MATKGDLALSGFLELELNNQKDKIYIQTSETSLRKLNLYYILKMRRGWVTIYTEHDKE